MFMSNYDLGISYLKLKRALTGKVALKIKGNRYVDQENLEIS
jgi:hypothetical protein